MSVAVGWLLLAAGLKYFVTLIAFYFLGTAATKFRSAAKMGLVSEGGTGKAYVYGRRGAQQVAIKGDAFFWHVELCGSDLNVNAPRSGSCGNKYCAFAFFFDHSRRRRKQQQRACPRRRLPRLHCMLCRCLVPPPFHSHDQSTHPFQVIR